MVWYWPFSSGSSSSSDPKPPARQDRKRCWESRDAYHGCLDMAGVVKPGDEGKACTKQLAAYEKNCAESWIQYFNERRVLAEQQKESLAMVNAQADEARRKSQ